jgi:hypothetical protein
MERGVRFEKNARVLKVDWASPSVVRQAFPCPRLGRVHPLAFALSSRMHWDQTAIVFLSIKCQGCE